MIITATDEAIWPKPQPEVSRREVLAGNNYFLRGANGRGLATVLCAANIWPAIS